MFTMRGEAKWIPPQGTGPVRRERRRQLKGGVEVPKTFEGERVKQMSENPYGSVALKKRFIKKELEHAIPMDTPDRDLVIEQLVDRAYTGPTQSEFFKANTKSEMRGVIEQVLTEQGMGSESEPQMTAEEAEAEAAAVAAAQAEMERLGYGKKEDSEVIEALPAEEEEVLEMPPADDEQEEAPAKTGAEAFFAAQPDIEGDEPEVIDQRAMGREGSYKTETVSVPEELPEDAIEALPAEDEEVLEMPPADDEEEEDKPKAAAIGLTSGVAGSAMGAQKATGQKTAPETGASKEVAQVDRTEFLNKLAEQRKEQLKQKLESGMTLEDLNEMLDYEIEDADMDIEELGDDQESMIKQAINKREVALKLKEWLASQSDAAAAK